MPGIADVDFDGCRLDAAPVHRGRLQREFDGLRRIIAASKVERPLRCQQGIARNRESLWQHAADDCQAHTDVETHHVRRLKDLHIGSRADQPGWARQMASRRRKTLIVCRDCHDGIHNGFPPERVLRNVALESDVR